jgi:hypothetical protein
MRRATTAITMAAVLALAGCTPGESDAEPAPVDEAGTGGTGTTVEESPDPTDPACLVGDWQIAEDQMQSFYDATTGEVEGITFEVVGGVDLSFTVDEYRYTSDFTLLLDVEGAGSGEGVATGGLGGSYTAEDGVITTTLVDNDLAVVVTVLGQTIDGSDLAGGLLESDPINEAPFDCSTGNPVLQFETSTGRTPVELTPAG